MRYLKECTVAQLQSVAKSIGSNTGGKKAELCLRLLAEAQQDRFGLDCSGKDTKQRQHKIVSIDMGIRNLAICAMTVPPDWYAHPKSLPPIIQEWARIAVSKKAAPESSGETEVPPEPKEAFDPPTYAQHAYDLVSDYIMPLKPTQILIERQRFRSMGGSAVQEWTLRVNMFEAMIYAILKTFSERRLWHGAVYPVAPAKVSKFWLGDKDASKIGKSSSSKTKAAKIALVRGWLSDGKRFQLQGNAVDVAKAYHKKLAGPKARKIQFDQEIATGQENISLEVGKLDDLADCLLQAMAWIKWEENRRALVSGD